MTQHQTIFRLPILTTILIFAFTACSNNNNSKIRYDPSDSDLWLHKHEGFGIKDDYHIRYYRDKLLVIIKKKGKNQLYIRDYDFSKNNGIDEVENKGKGITCYRHKKPRCSKKVLTKGKQLFDKMLKKLKFKYYYRKWRRRTRTDDDYLDGYK